MNIMRHWDLIILLYQPYAICGIGIYKYIHDVVNGWVELMRNVLNYQASVRSGEPLSAYCGAWTISDIAFSLYAIQIQWDISFCLEMEDLTRKFFAVDLWTENYICAPLKQRSIPI